MLYEYQTGPLLERLHNGEIDVGILALPVALDGLESPPLYDEPFMLAVPANHPLAAHDRVEVEDLHGETLLLLEDGHCLRDQALEVCSRIGVREEQDYRATSLETLRQMVAAGHGITLLPNSPPTRRSAPRAACASSHSRSRRRRARSERCGASPRPAARRSTAVIAAIRDAMKDCATG